MSMTQILDVAILLLLGNLNLVVLKLAGQIDWSWWLVTLPFWGAFAGAFAVLFVAAILAVISAVGAPR